MREDLAAGAAAVNIDHIGADYCARRGIELAPPEWPQQIRCLALAQGEALIVLFNADWGTWPKLLAETREIVASLAPDRSVEVLCFGTRASHNVDFDGIHWGTLDPKDKRHDPILRAQILDAVGGVAAQALKAVHPVRVTVGQGRCDSLAVNFYTGNEPDDPAVSVIRLADADEHLIAALVTVACRTDDRDLHLSAGLAGATAATVQSVYGPVPIFYLNSGGGDHYRRWLSRPCNCVSRVPRRFGRRINSDLYRLMEIVSARKYWGSAAGRAKWETRYGKRRETSGEIRILSLGREVAAVCFPANLCPTAVEAIKAQSPFAVTLFWSEMGPWNMGQLIPEAEELLGGVHYGSCDYAQEAIDAMNTAIIRSLHAIYDDLASP